MAEAQGDKRLAARRAARAGPGAGGAARPRGRGAGGAGEGRAAARPTRGAAGPRGPLAALRAARARPARAGDVLASLPRTPRPRSSRTVRARLGRACELLGDREGAIAAYAQAFPLRRLDDELAARLEALYTESGRDARAGRAVGHARSGARGRRAHRGGRAALPQERPRSCWSGARSPPRCCACPPRWRRIPRARWPARCWRRWPSWSWSAERSWRPRSCMRARPRCSPTFALGARLLFRASLLAAGTQPGGDLPRRGPGA